MVRRVGNSIEELGLEETCRVVDGYTQKILNCGYIKEQTQRIVVDGIKRHNKGRRTNEVGYYASGEKTKKYVCV